MKDYKIFIGNIRKCTKYDNHTVMESKMFDGDMPISIDRFGYIESDSELYKENAILIQFENGGYIDLENFNSIIDYIKIRKDTRSDGYLLGGLMMSTSPHALDCLFVEEEPKLYYDAKESEVKMTVRQIKKQFGK